MPASVFPPPPAAPVPRFVISPAGRLLSSLGCLFGGWLALVALFFVRNARWVEIDPDKAHMPVMAGLFSLLFMVPVWLVVVLPLFLLVPHRSRFWSILCAPLCFGMVGFGVMSALFRFDASPLALRCGALAALVGLVTGLCAAAWQRELRRRAAGQPPYLWPAPPDVSGPRFVISPVGRTWRSLVCALGGWLVMVVCHFLRSAVFIPPGPRRGFMPTMNAIYSLPLLGMVWLLVALPLFLCVPHRSRFWSRRGVVPFLGAVGFMVMNPHFPFAYTEVSLRFGGWAAVTGAATGLFCAAWQGQLRERAASLTLSDAAD